MPCENPNLTARKTAKNVVKNVKPALNKNVDGVMFLMPVLVNALITFEKDSKMCRVNLVDLSLIVSGRNLITTTAFIAERGFNKKIVDRLDLTIECIRRFYLGESSPLNALLTRYKDFFDIFGGFKEYIEFFLLQDAVSDDYTSVKIAVPFDNFASSPIPNDVDEYLKYMDATSNFINMRNLRIAGA